ncbi:MAG: competence/damage-inducible protein A [Cytophagia bacterium]|nr:MAG: competence/damage-inducible protein A [Cytophagia bacterium]TAG38706.1 MAG: competence/damage-inducible protein A [Cytophagia bacterium]
MKTIFAEIITIGDEILYGQITNTNSQFISSELDKIGVKVIRHISVSDKANEIKNAIIEAETRADVIIMTGGLGPTKDDITKKTLAEYFDSPMHIDLKVMQWLEDFFTKRGRELSEINKLQALVPDKCKVIYNDWGTAPAMWFEKFGKIFISMPGVPSEMKNLMTNKIIPDLQSYFKTPIILHKIVHTIGIGESMIAEKIAEWEDNLPQNMGLAYLPNYIQVRLRLTGMGENKEILEQEMQAQINTLLPQIEKYIFGFDNDTLEQVVANLLLEKRKTVSTAESCTGGNVGHLFTKIAGSSRYYEGGIISYTNEVKTKLLGVNPQTLAEFGAVSEQTVREMAEGVRKKLGTDIGLATTGVAGPDGATIENPVGTVWIAYSDENKTLARKLTLVNDRLQNIQFASLLLLEFMRKNIG